jgi:hypothetical protein
VHKQVAEEAVTSRAPIFVLGLKEWLGLFAIAALTVMAALTVYRLAVPSESQVHDRQVSSALRECQHRILEQSEYSGAEVPPYSKNHSRGSNEFYFVR